MSDMIFTVQVESPSLDACQAHIAINLEKQLKILGQNPLVQQHIDYSDFNIDVLVIAIPSPYVHECEGFPPLPRYIKQLVKDNSLKVTDDVYEFPHEVFSAILGVVMQQTLQHNSAPFDTIDHARSLLNSLEDLHTMSKSFGALRYRMDQRFSYRVEGV